MAAGPLKTISFLPLPVKGKPLRNGGGAVNHRGHREYSGRAIVGTGRKSHAVVISRLDLTPSDVRNWLQCETGLDNDRRARIGGETSTTENREDGYKEDQSTSHAVTDHDISFSPFGAICEGSLLPNSASSVV
jgi:hypothetical protein